MTMEIMNSISMTPMSERAQFGSLSEYMRAKGESLFGDGRKKARQKELTEMHLHKLQMASSERFEANETDNTTVANMAQSRHVETPRSHVMASGPGALNAGALMLAHGGMRA